MTTSSELRIALWIVGALALLLPETDRDRWRREWVAELTHRARRIADDPSGVHGGRLWLAALAAWPDVWQLLRQQWRMETMWQDLRIALRGFVRTPVFTLVTIATLALGVGANTAVYSVVSAVILQPLDFEEPDDLVVIWESNLERGWSRFTVAPANYLDWQASSTRFESMAAHTMGSQTVTGRGDPFEVRAAFLTPELFHVLRMPAARGTLFTSEHSEPSRANVAILTNEFWRAAFGAGADVIGRTISLDGIEVEIIGITPDDFDLNQFFRGAPVQILRPIAYDYDPQQVRGAHFFTVTARLADGVTPDEAQTEMDRLAGLLAEQYPETNEGWGTVVVPLIEQILGPTIRTRLFVIWGAVGLVLLLACVNVANLLITRMTARRQEIAVRVALGARRARLLRQFLLEGTVLTLAGAGLGVVLAYAAISQLIRLDPGSVPRLSYVQIDGAVLLFTLVVAAGVGIVFALLPVLVNVRHVGDVLRTQRGSTSRGATHGLRTVLVVGEVAVALVIAIGSTLLARSFHAMQSVDPGFDASDVIAFELRPPADRYPDRAMVGRFYDQVFEAIRGLPGVRFVGSGAPAPLGGDLRFGYSIVGEPEIEVGATSALFRRVRGDYFRALGIPVVAGRSFDEQDRGSSPPVIIVNRAFAERYFPDESPLGRQLNLGMGDAACPCEIIGVVGDVRQYGATGDVDMGVYVPAAQLNGFPNQTVIVKTDPDVALAASIRGVVSGVDPMLAVTGYGRFTDRVSASLASPRFNMILVGSFAVLAVILAIVGIYGLLTYMVRLRTRELGVRLALGASPGAVRGIMVRHALALTAGGVVAGVLVAAGLARYLSSLLFGIETLDLVTFTAIPIALVIVGGLAGYGPARRASRVDPILVLREE